MRLKWLEFSNRVRNRNKIKNFIFVELKLEICQLEMLVFIYRLPLWSSGQSFWLQIQRSRVRFPALPNFLGSSGSGTGSTQPREVN